MSKVYCNKTTNVAHRRGSKGDPCYQRALKKGNAVNLDSFAAAKALGFRACKRCHPEK